MERNLGPPALAVPHNQNTVDLEVFFRNLVSNLRGQRAR
jgi:hypothetical protein